MSQITIQPDSLFQKRSSGEYILVIKSVTEKDGKHEYLLMDADGYEYNAISNELYPEGKLLRCLVRFKVKKGRFRVEKVGICRGQNLIPTTDNHLITQTNKKKKRHHKVKKDDTHACLSDIAPSDKTAIVEDVKKLIESRESGQTNAQLKSEIIRLHRVIVEGHLQDVVIEGCGKEGLKKVLGMARSIRRSEKKKEDKQRLSGKGDSEYKKLDSTLRNKWLEWHKGKFKSTANNKTRKQLYNAVRKAANYLNFVELQETCVSEEQFYRNGLDCCYKIAVNWKFFNLTPTSSSTPKKKSSPKRRKKTQDSYITSGSPHVTKKVWGSPYKPARG